MKLAILFHFDKHTESVSVNTNKLSAHLKDKIIKSLHQKDRLSLSFESFSSIKSQEPKKGFKKIDSIIGINVVLNT